MLKDSYKYATAIDAKGKEPFPSEALIMAEIFVKMALDLCNQTCKQ